MTTFGIVTAVSRVQNLPSIHQSIVNALLYSKRSTVLWILVIDEPGTLPIEIDCCLKKNPKELVVQRVMYPGARCIFGLAQKNMGIDTLAGLELSCYYHLLDDDNIVHPEFFVGLERAISKHPSKKAFVFGQQRWDFIGNLVASPDRMEFSKVDNTMFAVDIGLIGHRRYDLTKYGGEDFHFFNNIYRANSQLFSFLPETLAYYNFLKHFPDKIIKVT